MKNSNQTLKTIQETYNKIAVEFSNTRNKRQTEFVNFDKYIDDKSVILDLGCGNGRLYNYLNKKNLKNLNNNYFGIDFSTSMIKVAKKLNPKANFSYGDQLKIPFKNNKFDVIYNIRAFHHIPTRKLRIKSLLEIDRVLKKDGIVIMTVWNLWQKKYILNIIKSFVKSIISKNKYNDLYINWGKKEKRYYHAFTQRELKKLIKSNNFKILEFKKIGFDYAIIFKK